MALCRAGEVVGRVDHQDAVVSWPGCPRQWAAVRRWGQDALSLADICKWEVDRGTHLRADLPAGSARILREYMVLAEWPERIAKAKAQRLAREKRSGA